MGVALSPSQPTPARTTRYLLDGLSVIAQYAPDGHRQAWYTQSLARIDEVVNVANESGKFWYQADALGSVYGLTNQSGALIGTQNYDVFGAPTPAPSGPAGQPFGFTGREHELDSGLVYARARYLQPELGRWTAPDPIGQLAGPNYYVYARAQVTRHSDRLGLLTTLDAYAMGQPVAFIWLMVDLGVVAADVVEAVGGAMVLAEFISDARDRAKEYVDTCQRVRDDSQRKSYFRGLSGTDVKELWLTGGTMIYSKFVRQGLGGFVEALEYFVPGLLNHNTDSDNIAPGVPSPFVGVTTDEGTARGFSHAPPDPGHKTIRFTTTRRALPSVGPYHESESEYLFFLLLGEPGEEIEVLPDD